MWAWWKEEKANEKGSRESHLGDSRLGQIEQVPALLGQVGSHYFFWTYFRQSSITATRMMIPEKTNCRLVSIPKVVRE